MNPAELQAAVERAWEARETLNKTDTAVRGAVNAAIDLLDSGAARVAEPTAAGPSEAQHPVAPAALGHPAQRPSDTQHPVAPSALGHPAQRWKVNEWLKKAVLLYFRLHDNAPIEMGALHGYDKVPLKYTAYDAVRFAAQGVRVVPPAAIRRGAYVAPGAILMPSYVNIGAYVGEGTMVDTWATVGSCAQIGARVHLSGGVGIGGVLEPLQASPTIIEDDCFIGARSEIVEGVVIGKGAVISMGVFIGQSTPIYDRETGETLFGRVPAGSVVVAGSLPRDGGRYNLNCAVIVKKVDEKTRKKVGINALLRDL